jgi:hypothetical protein
MPFCDPANIPFVVSELQRLQPKSVVDVGAGMGGWGVVVREYLEFWYGRIERKDWKTELTGIEIFPGYRNELWTMYDHMEVGDAVTVLPRLSAFDVGLCCDVIEHLDKDTGRVLLETMLDRCATVILTTPVEFWPTGGPLHDANPKQHHLSLWESKDFAGTRGTLVNLGATFGASISSAHGSPPPRMQGRLEHIGARPLLKALGARVYRKIFG